MSNWIINIALPGAVLSGIAFILCECLDVAWSAYAAVASVFLICDITCILWMLCHIHDKPDPELQGRFDKKRWKLVIHNDPLTSDATDTDFHADRNDEDWHGL